MNEIPELLEDDGLRLRPLIKADLPEIARHMNDDRVCGWLAAVSQPFNATELLRHSLHPNETLRVIELAGDVVGGLCIGASLWYWLTPDHWGRGLMRRALTLAIASHFARSAAPPLVATCHSDNTASRALLTRLGFALCPIGRRMFFHGTQRAEPCEDYLMAPEQWHLLHPPRLSLDRLGGITLRPAQQKDAPTLSHMLPHAGREPWPEAEALPAFIEAHRFRGPARGLFVIEDNTRRNIGMVLFDQDGPHLRFLSREDETRHRATVDSALIGGVFPAS